MKINHKTIFIFLAWLLIAGCLCTPTGLPKLSAPTNSTQQPASGDQATAAPPSRPSAGPTAEQSASPLPAVSSNGLNSQPPWLLIATDAGLWAANPDGSGLQKMVENTLAGELAGAVRPNANQVAVITSSGDQIHNLALSLVSFPDGRVEKITDLTSSKTESSADANPGDPEFEAINAVGRAGLAWSPDGKKLAFIGLMDGPSADLYLYDLAGKKITRVTKDSSQNFSPAWSPDGKKLLVFGADSFGTGAGLTMAGVWSASADGSNVKSLYDPKNGSGEIFIGWRNNSTAILTSLNMMCGESQLRLYDLATSQTTLIQKDCVKAAASPAGAILYGDSQALYLLDSGSKKGAVVAKGETTYVKWSPASQIFLAGFADGRLITFDSQGKNQQETPVEFVLNAAARSGVWAWTSYNQSDPGVFISGPGMETGQIFTKNADVPIFDRQKNLIFFASQHLYRSTPPLYERADPVAEISENVQEVLWLGEK